MAGEDIYASFKTSKDVEREGVYLDYGKFRIKVARAGGANKAYQRLLEVKMRPLQRAIKTETLDPELAEDLMREVYAKTVVLGWDTKVTDVKGEPTWEVGKLRPAAGGELIKATPEAVAALFKALPDLFSDVIAQASSIALFREEIREDNAGN